MATSDYADEKQEPAIKTASDTDLPQYDGNSSINTISALVAEGERSFDVCCAAFVLTKYSYRSRP